MRDVVNKAAEVYIREPLARHVAHELKAYRLEDLDL